MVNFLDTIYTGIVDRNIFFSRIKIYSIQRLIIRVVSNFLIPLFYQFGKRKHVLDPKDSAPFKYIVSLTSFPNRIDRVWIVIESILRQIHKPDKIILWLSNEQFRTLGQLPQVLLNQQERGLDIKFIDGDLMSHKKYFYTLKDFPDSFLITVDDDIIYPTTLISQLIDLNEIYPKSIICHRAHRLKVENGKVLPYSSWNQIKEFDGPNFDIFFTSGGGTLFPPHSLHNDVLNDSVFKKYCLCADDVWLNIMSRLNSTTIVKSNYYSSLLPIINFRNINLYSTNLIQGENDKQLQEIRNYYIKKYGVDVF
jgi:hypothetical protein